jgi:hypothetical protein
MYRRSSSIVSKIFGLFVHERYEVLVVFDAQIDNELAPDGAGGVEVFFQSRWWRVPDIVKSIWSMRAGRTASKPTSSRRIRPSS